MSILTIDDATVVWSHDPAELAESPLVVLMHGRGSHEHDLPQLVPHLPAGAVYASPRAPLPFTGGGGYSWYPPAEPGAPSVASVDAAARAVLDWLDRVAPAGPVAALGFSQGGALATQLMRVAPERFAAFVNLSGFSVGEAGPADARLTSLRPRMFWGRADYDPIIPEDAIARTAEFLPAHSTLTERVYPGIAHSISAEELAEVSEFLAAAFAG